MDDVNPQVAASVGHKGDLLDVKFLWAMQNRPWRNLRRVLGTLAVWAVFFTGGSRLIKRDLLPAGPILWVVAALPTVVGVFVLVAFGRYLR